MPTSGKVGNLNRTLSELWGEWEQEGRVFWQEMDALTQMLDGLVEAGTDANAGVK